MKIMVWKFPTQAQIRATLAASRPPQVLVAMQAVLEKASAMPQKTIADPRPDFPPRLRLTSKIGGRSRGPHLVLVPGEVGADELADQQLQKIRANPELTVEEISTEPVPPQHPAQ